MRKIQFQVFAKASPSLGLPAKFNPYFAFGRFSIAIDSDGFLVEYGKRCFGYIRGAGWHKGFN